MLYIYTIYIKTIHVQKKEKIMTNKKPSQAAAKRKEFYSQLKYIAREMKKAKKENNFAFPFVGEYDNRYGVTTCVVDKIILNMSKKRLGALVSSSALNGIKQSRYWNDSSFCTSGHSYNGGKPLAFSVKKDYFDSICSNSKDTKAKYLDFISFISNRIRTLCSIYPKFQKFIIQRAEGIIAYSALELGEKLSVPNNFFVSLFKRSSDSRVLNSAVALMNHKSLVEAQKHIEESDRKYSSYVQYKIIQKLHNSNVGNAYLNWLDRQEKGADEEYNWGMRVAIFNSFKIVAKTLSDDEKVAHAQNLLGILANGEKYNQSSYISNHCLEYIIPFIPHEKRLFIVNAFDHSDRIGWLDKLKLLTFSQKSSWDY